MIILKIIPILILMIQHSDSVKYDCERLNRSISKEPFFGRYDEKYLALKIKDFGEFKEIQIKCNQTFKNIFIVELIPNQKRTLNNRLNISSLNIEFSTNPNLFVSNLMAIDLKASSCFDFNFKSNDERKVLDIGYSNFDVYFNNKPFVQTSCTDLEFYPNAFSNITALNLVQNNIFNKRISPLIFYKSTIKVLDIRCISNSFITKNLFEFLNIDNETSCPSEKFPSFESLFLTINYERVTNKLVNKSLFDEINFLQLSGLIYDMEYDLLKNFTKLNKIMLNLDKIEGLYQNGNKWLSYLRYYEKGYNLTLFKLFFYELIIIITHQTNIFSYVYDYPDQDFCLFYHFPHSKQVYPLIDPDRKINCSCTILWLIQYSFN